MEAWFFHRIAIVIHTLFAASREGEFVDRINGLSYEEITRKGGGILNSARKLQNASEEGVIKRYFTK